MFYCYLYNNILGFEMSNYRFLRRFSHTSQNYFNKGHHLIAVNCWISGTVALSIDIGSNNYNYILNSNSGYHNNFNPSRHKELFLYESWANGNVRVSSACFVTKPFVKPVLSFGVGWNRNQLIEGGGGGRPCLF